MSDQLIQHNETDSAGKFFIGSAAKPDAEMTYSRSGAHLIIISHTGVEPAFKGQGLGQKLLGALVSWARENQIKVIPLCPFAKAQIAKTPEFQDILATQD